MKKLVQAGVIAIAGIGVGMVVGGKIESRAAEEVRCRVNAEALVLDLAKLKNPADSDTIKKLLQPR